MKSTSLLTLLLLAACATPPTPALTPGTYRIVTLDGQPFAVDEPVTVTLAVELISGRGPVNRWSGGLDAQGNIGPIAATRMAGAPERMQLEDALFRALDGGTLRAQPDGRLSVMRGGKAVIVMEPAPAG